MVKENIGMTNIVFIKGNINSFDYQGILANNFFPLRDELMNQNLILLQHIASVHKSAFNYCLAN